MLTKGYPTPQDRHEEVWQQGLYNMDLLDGESFWYMPSYKYTKGNYFIFIFRASIVCVALMALWMQKEHHYLFSLFLQKNWYISWSC